MMKPMSFSETIFLFFLALIVFGPKKLPEIARQVGKWMNEFRRASNEFKSQIEQEISNLEVEDRKRKILPPSPAPTGTTSRTSHDGASSEAGSGPATTATPASPTSPSSSADAAAQTDDEPLFAADSGANDNGANKVEPAANAAPANPSTETVATSISQESHA